MGSAGIGWIAAIIIGGLAGWIASNFMNSNTGIFMNIILGIIGAAVASFIFGLLGVSMMPSTVQPVSPSEARPDGPALSSIP